MQYIIVLLYIFVALYLELRVYINYNATFFIIKASNYIK
jgi:hypothetical protein